MKLEDIATVRIHPAIGVARVGNSPDHFLGPEIPGVPPAPSDGKFKDSQGRIKRQAVRFRCFGYNEAGDAWIELTDRPGEVAVHWTVHVANRKAASLRFQADSPRNAGMDRGSLVIDPGPRTLRGPGEAHCLDGGRFALDPGGADRQAGVEVPLGEVRTEATGHLLVLGARGIAASPNGSRCDDFADNDGWYDDSCDGPVDAVVHLRGREPLRAQRAWVIAAPPKFAPQLDDVVTVWDQLIDLFSDGLGGPARPSYTRDIHPILRRARTMRALNRAAGGRNHTRWPEPLYGFYGRRKITSWLRPLGFTNPKDKTGDGMPMLAGGPLPHLTRVQYAAMMKWRDGEFERDWPAAGPLDAEAGITPAGLDRAALEACVGAVFEPGIEAGRFFLDKGNWHADNFDHPSPGFRFHDRLGPGDVSARMAVPWQADFYACGDYWWPVSRPNQVVPGDAEQGAPEYLGWDRRIGNIRRMADWWHCPGFVVADASGEYREVERQDPPPPEPPPHGSRRWTAAVVGAGPEGDGHVGVWQQPEHLSGADLACYGRGELAHGQEHSWPLWLTEADRSLTVTVRSSAPDTLSVGLRTPYGVVLKSGDPRLDAVRGAGTVTIRLDLPVEVAPQRFAREGQWEVEVRAHGQDSGAVYQLTVAADSDILIGPGTAHQAPDGTITVATGLGDTRVDRAVARVLIRGAEQEGAEVPLSLAGPGAFTGSAGPSSQVAAVRLQVEGVSGLGYPFVRERFLTGGTPT